MARRSSCITITRGMSCALPWHLLVQRQHSLQSNAKRSWRSSNPLPLITISASWTTCFRMSCATIAGQIAASTTLTPPARIYCAKWPAKRRRSRLLTTSACQTTRIRSITTSFAVMAKSKVLHYGRTNGLTSNYRIILRSTIACCLRPTSNRAGLMPVWLADLLCPASSTPIIQTRRGITGMNAMFPLLACTRRSGWRRWMNMWPCCRRRTPQRMFAKGHG